KVPLASQVICADSEMVKLLEEDVEDTAERMKVATSPVIKNKYDEFVINFMDSITDIPDNRFLHDKSWKESDKNLAKVTTDILEILKDIWKNLAFKQKLAKSQSEGIYMTDVIVPLIRALLKDLPIGNCNNRSYELIFAKSSRIVCDEQKKNDNEVKLWREMNNVRGTEMRLNTLVWGVDEIDRLYNLFTVEISIQLTNKDIVFRFVENILHVNISLLFYASPVSSSSNTENSSMVSSPRREGEQIMTRKMNLSEIDSLKLELEQIVKEKNVLEAKNANLRQIIEENSRHDVEFKSRIEELEKCRVDTTSENAELKTKVVKLRRDFKEIKSKRINTDSLEQLPIFLLAKNEISCVFKTVSQRNDQTNSSKQFPYLTLKYSNEYGDYFNCPKTCLICNKEHKRDDEKGEWESGDYINTKI
ncbi:12473_t:CDS:2, partial [Gigaspora margarita]